MRSEEIVRSWKDESYRLGLNDKEQALGLSRNSRGGGHILWSKVRSRR